MTRIKTALLSLTLLFSFGVAAGCSPASVDDLCEKAGADEQAECKKELAETKEKLGDELWAELAKCLDGKDKINEEAYEGCITDEMKKKQK